KPADNTIEVRVDNSLDFSRTLPLRNNINYPKNYGGIYRDIYILAVPKVFIRSLNLSSEIDINFNADVKNTVTITSSDVSKLQINNEKNLNVKTEIIDSSGNIKGTSEPVFFSIASNSTIQVINNLNLSNPIYWSYDEPHVYTVKVILSNGTNTIDMYQMEFGVFEWRFSPFNTLIINK